MYSFVSIIILNLQGAYTGTIFSFFLGILWYEKGNDIIHSIKTNYTVSIVVSFCIFLAFYGFTKVIDNSSVPLQNILSFVLNNLSAISFIICIMIVFQKIQLKGIVSLFLGRLSYEIYLVHITVLGVLKLENIIKSTNENVFIAFMILFTITLTLIVHYTSSIISKRL